MKKNIFHLLKLSILSILFMVVFYLPTHAAACTLTPGNGSLSAGVFEVTPWYKYLPGDNTSGRCTPAYPRTSGGSIDIAKTAALISVAIIELLTRVAGLIAAGFVIYGAFQYITSQGEPEGLANAKNTITNALIGFVIVVLAISIVQFIGRAFR